MSDIRLVSHAYFHDEQDLLITGGVNGVFLFNFQYTGNYKPILAAKVDIHGNHIKINLVNQRPVEKMLEWCKGLKLDAKSHIIISWNIMYVSLNQLTPEGKLLV